MSDEAEGRASARPGLQEPNANALRTSSGKGEGSERTRGSASLRPWTRLIRKHAVHLPPKEAHNRSIIVFVTACTAKRRKILACRAAHQALMGCVDVGQCVARRALRNHA